MAAKQDQTKSRAKGGARRHPARAARTVAPPVPSAPDEFGAAGGMPMAPAGLPAADFSQAHHAVHELSWSEFERYVEALARAARRFKPEAVVGLVQGGVFVGGALASALHVEFFPVRVSQRSRDAHLAGVVDEMPKELAGRRVLVVDDVASSGDSLEFALRLLKALGARASKTAALVARPGRYAPDFVALESADFFVFPWDYAGLLADARFATGEEDVAAPPPRRGQRRPAQKAGAVRR